MSLIPAFQIGLWNAWIFIGPLIILWFLGVKFIFKKRMPENTPPGTKRDKITSNILIVNMLALYLYSIFLPIELGTVWFYIGTAIYLIGLIFIITAMINFATTPMKDPVTKGIYHFSRNPMFISFFLVFSGVAVACISWVYFLITLFFLLNLALITPMEEKETLKHYGRSYEEYMKRTPKWIGIPGSKGWKG